ncbi:hypothetical protein HMPREF0063_10592 [Aeromicrobium marinum DSM 15272]|uniref:Uncharacterized protein n=1 Tax=Aeromicrobium marinum DSM 15272 TaxID=585531 RepID=E2S9F2_9ACTN|nr:hypothetical protein [Aeromicrobium marinum]EFQ83876.1 hypothetical protein HMPREF0063_10592 [Aeromicrobium marinum DSM 15272]
MSVELILLLTTAVLAVVAVTAAVVAVRAARRVRVPAPVAAAPDRPERVDLPGSAVDLVARPVSPSPARVVEGRIVVSPTSEQVVATALSRPATRLSVWAHGVSHALRPESRDRISGLMRREYRRRRRLRARAARQAARQAVLDTPPPISWLGDGPDRAAG